MLYSSHTHSPEFCTHALSPPCPQTLESVIRHAISLNFSSIILTEHIPRPERHYYPNEEQHKLVKRHGDLHEIFSAYIVEARRLQKEYAGDIDIIVGFEGEWIPCSLDKINHNDDEQHVDGKYIRDIFKKDKFDTWIGSIHHVYGIPIDYDEKEYKRAAREVVQRKNDDNNEKDNTEDEDEVLASIYFNEQYDMINDLEPPIIGHFDLVRLFSQPRNKDRDWRTWSDGRVWKLIVRNLQRIKDYDGIMEVNSAALRKGLREVYPRKEIMEEWRRMGGRMTLSDDSHGVDHLCTHYGHAFECIKAAGIDELYYAAKTEDGIEWKSVGLTVLVQQFFCNQQKMIK